MKIICSVEIINRTLPSLNIANKKALRSCLTIGSGPDKNIYLFHQTNQNPSGNKYKIKDNVANLFIKFVNEGKATVRFKQPEHDLAISCDAIQLKGFLRTLKLCLDGLPSAHVSRVPPGNSLKKPLKHVKTKLKISSTSEYPVVDGFPRTLEHLSINNVNQNVFDNRILRLRNLQSLNLQSNCLTTLPEQFGSSLPNLSELYLTHNKLGLGNDWRWIVNNRLQKRLRLLDLRFNEIAVLPDKIVKLENLLTLKLDNNQLKNLPCGFGFLKSLRYFSASNNDLKFLPRSLFLLNLESVDLSGNAYDKSSCKKLNISDFQKVPPLLDIAASCVISKRIEYSPAAIPYTLVDYIESGSFCLCGKLCFSSLPEGVIQYQNPTARAMMVLTHYDCVVTLAVRFCSFHCYNKSLTNLR